MRSRAGKDNSTLHSSKAVGDTKQTAYRPHHLVLSLPRSSTATAVCSAPTSWPRLPRTMEGGSTGAAPWYCKTSCGCTAHAVVMHEQVHTEHALCCVHVCWSVSLTLLLVCRCPKPKEEGQCRFFQWADELGQQPPSAGQ